MRFLTTLLPLVTLAVRVAATLPSTVPADSAVPLADLSLPAPTYQRDSNGPGYGSGVPDDDPRDGSQYRPVSPGTAQSGVVVVDPSPACEARIETAVERQGPFKMQWNKKTKIVAATAFVLLCVVGVVTGVTLVEVKPHHHSSHSSRPHPTTHPTTATATKSKSSKPTHHRHQRRGPLDDEFESCVPLDKESTKICLADFPLQANDDGSVRELSKRDITSTRTSYRRRLELDNAQCCCILRRIY
ncbi:hypothetical protein EV361DRAFT_646408 [Lentinula raphanica]|uniref:Transmembrane protein n=1 Tax=Lentinula raphanica TaxID=153919 RepID=A0AA38U6E7_9AGAR|nr:hypothetical protein F5880DRAFT_1579781 [Lentinula raphanica]KAJ3833202.1 hypothetical protein F5878DRAFT_713367 [Lentinula raphanica]KAJ3965529.1 hypothetical protein EV361DRAFT_646408 [Lentinula raphanica]